MPESRFACAFLFSPLAGLLFYKGDESMSIFQSKKTKNVLIAVFSILAFALVIGFSVYFYDDAMADIEIINDPSFIGEVVGKRTFFSRFGTASMPVRNYELHIIGSYIENDEEIAVDRKFLVPRYLFEKFEIGDLIGYGIEADSLF